MEVQFQEFFVLAIVGVLMLAAMVFSHQLRRLLIQFKPILFHNKAHGPVKKGLFLTVQSGRSDEINKLNRIVAELEQARVELERQKARMEEALLMVEKDNYRKTEELLEAQQLQLSMLPQHTPFYPGYEIALYSEPATEVGGDYYDYRFSRQNQVLHLVLGDATGHGFKPAVLVATAKSYFQTQVGSMSNENVLSAISKAIRSLNTKGLYMGLSLLEIENDLVSITSSGMPPVYYYDCKKDRVEQCLFKGMFLGIREENKGYKRVFRMHKGDILLLMTDGLAETKGEDGELLGYKAIEEAFIQSVKNNSAITIIQDLLKLGAKWGGSKGKQQDDISMTLIKRK